MNATVIVSMVFLFSGFILNIIAGIMYNPPIQRYLEKLGVAPFCFLYSFSGLRDYVNAKKLARRWGHKPDFLTRYERLQVAAWSLFTIGLLTASASQLFGF